ncbi:MAG: hypothetical protein PF549_03730, partial [Patescibacteria group bacterium]|nr:hypothetical protein [Patescibacteria group bacterium]
QGSGGGYGGKGGNGNGITGGSEYDQVNIHQPTELGSGGGLGFANGGIGGGAIKLNISGTFNNGGSVLSNGGAGGASAGGGSGGSIWIEASTITGTGTISADGGLGTNNGGGGAGGRIALSGLGDLTVTAIGGTGYQVGEDGSIYLSASGSYTSEVLDFTDGRDFTTVDITKSASGATVSLHGGDTDDPSTWADNWLEINDTDDISAFDGFRYLQYKVEMTFAGLSDDPDKPSVEDISINYLGYASESVANIDFTTESNYVQEDATIGTDYDSGVAKLQVFTCGDSFTKSHSTTDGVAPVNKTVTYDTVASSLTGTNKCWITRNLGASQQATSATDATEASAGWYWQFNRKQGYQYTTTRTPSSAWIASIDEDSDWTTANDPCAIELGTGWRLPTSAEWTNADATGGWDNYNETYASALKLHAVGALAYTNGVLNMRGGNGYYWSSTQSNSTAGQMLVFSSALSIAASNNKANGYGVRCIKDTLSNYPTSQAYHITTATGSQIDTSTWNNMTGISITQTTPPNTSIKYLVSFDDKSTWKYWNGSSWETSDLDNLQTNGMSEASLEAISQTQWESTGGFNSGTTTTLDFAFDLATTDSSVTPEVDQVQISYISYPSSLSLTSSPYNTSSPANLIGGISWEETLDPNTNIKFQLRTSADNSTWTDWMGPDGTSTTYFDDDDANCTEVSGTITCNQDSIPTELTSGDNDQYVQYRSYLISETGAYTPTLSEVTITYVVNANPEIQNVTATQNPDGTVSIQYEALDPDTDDAGAANQGFITPSFEYFDGSDWQDITTITASAITEKDVEQTTWTTYGDDSPTGDIITWDAKTDFPNQYMDGTAKIRVTIDDSEGANNTASADSPDFTLDTTPPVITDVDLNASTDPAEITITSTDNSTYQMRIAQGETEAVCMASLSLNEYQTYNSTPTLELDQDPATNCLQLQDQYSNTTDPRYVTSPETPTAFMVQDTTNMEVTPDPEYRLFIAWKISADPNFNRYELYRSTDNITFESIFSKSTISTNSYPDNDIVGDQLYYYKIKIIDQQNNQSYFSETISANANGIQDYGEGGGGTSTAPPVISEVEFPIDKIYTSQATITWNTDVPSNSTVGYYAVIPPVVQCLTAPCSFTTEIGSDTMYDFDDTNHYGPHTVVLSNLTPDTDYYFQVKSTSTSGYTGTEDNEGVGYHFKTLPGPKIIQDSVTISKTNNSSATINWVTDEPSSSSVTYSTSSDMSDPANFLGTNEDSTNHEVTINDLTQGVKYYFYVESSYNG